MPVFYLIDFAYPTARYEANHGEAAIDQVSWLELLERCGESRAFIRASVAWFPLGISPLVQAGSRGRHGRVIGTVLEFVHLSPTNDPGKDGKAGQACYPASKAEVIGLTKTMAKQWGRYSISLVAPWLAP